MTKMWYAAETLDKGMQVSSLLNDTIIKINIISLENSELQIDEIKEFDKKLEEARNFLILLLETVKSVERGGKELFYLDMTSKIFVNALIENRVGDCGKLKSDISIAIQEINNITINPKNDVSHLYSILSELYGIAVTAMEENKELILVPTR